MATDAFVHGMQVAAAISAIAAVGVAILTVTTLRNAGPPAEATAGHDVATMPAEA